MTIASTNRLAGPYVGTGSVSTYPFGFKVFKASDVLVLQTDTSGNITTLALTTNYTVALNSDQNANPGGSITLNAPLITGYTLVISSQVPELQGTSITNNGGFYPQVIENSLDYLTILAQQIQTNLSNCFQLPITVTGVSTTLPTPAASQLLGWNASGTALVNTSPTGVGAQTVTGGAAGAGGNIALNTITDSNVNSTAGIQSSKLSYLLPATGALATTIQTVLNERVSVMRFGAVGNGVANDGPAIVAAATYCAGINKELFLPAGTYRILTYVSLPANTKLVGEPGTIVHIDPACTLGTVNIGGTNRAFYASGVSGISFKGIVFESVTTGLTQQVNVALNATSNIRVDDCTFRNFGNGSFYCQGLVMLGCSDIIVRASKFTGNSGDGLAIGNSSSSFQVSGNTVSGNGDFGIAVTLTCNEGTITNNMVLSNTSTGIGTDRCTNIAITGNTLVNNAYGIRVCRFALDSNLNQYVTVSGNVVNGAGTIGISVEECTSPGGVTVAGNSILGVSGGAGINVSDSCVVTVSGNTVYSTTGASVLVQSFNASYETGRIAIVGNSLNNGTYGIQQVTGPGTITSITAVGNDINNMSTGLYTFLANKANYLMTAASYLDISNTLNFPSGISAGSATAGGGTAIPATTKGFLVMFLGGNQIKVPYYSP